MTARFKNSMDRVKRAAYHSRALDSEWKAILGSPDTQTYLCDRRHPGWFTVIAALGSSAREQFAENTLALELGEFAYQLRAALDGLMWDALTHIHGAEPASHEATRLEFPIVRTDAEFSKRGFHQFRFPQKLKEWLESVQPYKPDKEAGDPDRSLGLALEGIHNLARLDRHRRLRTVAALPMDASFIPITTPSGGTIIRLERLSCDLFSGQDELAKMKVECAGGITPYHVRLRANVTFEILFEGFDLYSGEGMGIQLQRFAKAVAHTIARFEAEFPPV